MFCHNIPGLLEKLKVLIYNTKEWRMFIDSSKWSFCVLVHNDNLFGAVSIRDSVFVMNIEM